MERYLFRGVNPQLHADTKGILVPKTFEPFRYAFHYGESVYYGGGAVYGESTANAVLRHQQNQAGFPTSGVSTTPIVERAAIYATLSSKYSSGFVYKIDTAQLPLFDVTAYVVADYAVQPSVPEDNEVILVAQDFGALPREIVVEIIEVHNEFCSR
jgi:hypothetical protein